MRISDWSSDVCSSDLVALREARVAYESVERQGIDGTIVATLGEGADQDAAQRAILAVLPTIQLSMEGGGVVTAKVPDAEVNQIVSSAIEQNVGTLRNRINEIGVAEPIRSEEHTSELQSLMRISYAVFCLKKKNNNNMIIIN